MVKQGTVPTLNHSCCTSALEPGSHRAPQWRCPSAGPAPCVDSPSAPRYSWTSSPILPTHREGDSGQRVSAGIVKVPWAFQKMRQTTECVIGWLQIVVSIDTGPTKLTHDAKAPRCIPTKLWCFLQQVVSLSMNLQSYQKLLGCVCINAQVLQQ